VINAFVESSQLFTYIAKILELNCQFVMLLLLLDLKFDILIALNFMIPQYFKILNLIKLNHP